MVWKGIMKNHRSASHMFQGRSITTCRYVDKILVPYLRQFRGAIELVLLMDDSYRHIKHIKCQNTF